MKLVANWRDVLKRAWSMRMIGLTALVNLVWNVVPGLSNWLPWWLTIGLLLVAGLTRLVEQENLPSA